MVQGYCGVGLLHQANAGPAAARNRGAAAARGTVLVFTDDDCIPMPDWLDTMLEPFEDPQVVGAKGVYRTRQKSLAARFVQIEYEDKYRVMAGFEYIDFVDTYSAAFRRDRFLEIGGYDTSFPLACAEDVELSYRMSARGWKMKFAPEAIVYHTHPDTLWRYLKKKYKFAFWRVLAVRRNPSKAMKDSHTPQLMKLQLLFAPALLLAFDSSGSACRPCFNHCARGVFAQYAAIHVAGICERSCRGNAFAGSAGSTGLRAVAGSCGRPDQCRPQACPGGDEVHSLKQVHFALVRNTLWPFQIDLWPWCILGLSTVNPTPRER